MLNKSDAEESALRVVRAEFGLAVGDNSIVILEEHTLESPLAWYFVYNTKSCVESGDPMLGLIGNGPIVVPKDGSMPEIFSSGYSVSQVKLRYETGQQSSDE